MTTESPKTTASTAPETTVDPATGRVLVLPPGTQPFVLADYLRAYDELAATLLAQSDTVAADLGCPEVAPLLHADIAFRLASMRRALASLVPHPRWLSTGGLSPRDREAQFLLTLLVDTVQRGVQEVIDTYRVRDRKAFALLSVALGDWHAQRRARQDFNDLPQEKLLQMAAQMTGMKVDTSHLRTEQRPDGSFVAYFDVIPTPTDVAEEAHDERERRARERERQARDREQHQHQQ